MVFGVCLLLVVRLSLSALVTPLSLWNRATDDAHTSHRAMLQVLYNGGLLGNSTVESRCSEKPVLKAHTQSLCVCVYAVVSS